MTIFISENIKKLRQQKELTQETLADFLGVSFQSVSKWERGESYPDITLLPNIADFFGISCDELLGIDKVKNEAEIIEQLQKYDNFTDKDLKFDIIINLNKKFPTDFRILLRYMSWLIHFSEKNSDIVSKITAIYNNIQQNCTVDKIRISAKRHIVELYHTLVKNENSSITFEDCEKIIIEMPRMRDGQELFCFFYPKNHPERDTNIQNAIEEEITLLDTTISHYYFYDERFSLDFNIDILSMEINYLNFLYDDGNYGRMWRIVMYKYGHLGVRYFAKGEVEKALENLKKSAKLAIQFDEMDRVTIMHSKLFDGKEFDKHTLGSIYSAKNQMKYLMIEKYPLSDEFKESAEFKEIINML
ncbi:hypothetical protein SDC9_99503 [bioreactor metagenome]|uniref:HTH cro/C1-type domain-containing protein n=1 Tax=bioreactor metagenome TaxID=1076179 RepID=A0A645AKC1_9ZZZZ